MTTGFLTKFFKKSAADPLNLKNSHTATENERRLIELCSMPAQEALGWLFSEPRGLSSENAEQRLHKFGANELAHTKELSFLADIFERCKSPLVIQLLLIAAISAFIGEIKSTVIVGMMVF
jgi:P-type Mg2+ transporter